MDFNFNQKPTLRQRIRQRWELFQERLQHVLECVDNRLDAVVDIRGVYEDIAYIVLKREIHLLELIFGCFAINQGILMLTRFNIYTTSPSYNAMSYVPQYVWGVFGLVVGLLQIRGVITENKVTRLVGSALAISFWTSYFVSFILVAFNTAPVTYFGFVLANIVIHFRVQVMKAIQGTQRGGR